MIDERQTKLIELLVSGDYTTKDACKNAGVPLTTYYEWRKNDSKPGKEFNKYYDEALELKVKESRRTVKSNVNELLDSLLNISKKGKNENARVNAVAKLMNYAELDPSDKQELTVKDGQDDANKLLEMWQSKKKDKPEKE
ncbi:phBC6A51 family helix-turn-helix protein [Virgibacillus sp. CBA3643]|uniref:phBC6A51 family helix-turn-helix protein n=1 Tax=Virgibacillus sp. CBA3643 TaxID=2942278 RepID=UPI0035A34D4F